MNECTDEPPSVETESTKVSDKLLALGGNLKEIEKVKRKYPMKINFYYLNLIKNKDDPIWLQAVPSIDEINDEYNVEDPLHEEECTKVPYLVHKYPDRALLHVSNKCAMYCRFCTRKRKVGINHQIPMENIFEAIQYIHETPTIRDVIISGGDPLLRSDSELEQILSRLRSIPHLEMIRIGTRMPCVQPSRITKRFVNMLKKYHPLFMNIHFNHPSEITPESSYACKLLSDAGIPLGSQTVLLKGVNDSPEIMKELMHKLLQIRVKPYYIYQCDLVKGVEHFRTEVDTGMNIIKNIQGHTSGLAVPHFIIDNEGGKIPIYPDYIKGSISNGLLISNYQNNIYRYKNPLKKSTNKRIGFVYNMKKDTEIGESPDLYSEFDEPSTIYRIRDAIKSGGYEVIMLEADETLFENLKKSNIDFVFNMAEGLYGESRESQVPAILDMLKIPYSGSGVLTQALTLNKKRGKEILDYYGVPTPKSQLFITGNEEIDSNLRFPMIVKPNSEGSSKGINNNSLVFDTESLRKQISFVIENYNQEALVEEYCTGKEFTVSVLGNKNPKVLPIVEVTYDYLPEGVHKFDSFEVKWIYDNPNSNHDPLICPANISLKLQEKIEKVALDAYKALDIKDYCRMDIRLDNNEIPNILDINALPGLIPDPKENSRFPRACFTLGMSYDEIILSILHTAMERYNILKLVELELK